MTTKATRRALDYLETITASGYFHPEALAQFRAEVEAIERAAKAYAREDSSSMDDDVIAALRVMDSIAKDAP